MSIDSREGKYYPVCDYCGIELEGKSTFKEAVQEGKKRDGITTGKRKRISARIARIFTERDKRRGEEMLTEENAVKIRIGQESLCWTCGKSITNGCSWAREFKPVQGWVARKRGYATVKGAYDVRYCPEYDNDSCYVKKDDFWGDCSGDCYSCPHWRDSYGNKFNKKERQPKGEEE